MLFALSLFGASAFDPSVSVNTTSVHSGQSVNVSWSAPAGSVRPYKIVWSRGEANPLDGHAEAAWREEPANGGSLWLGQFSPPVTDASQIKMGTDPTADPKYQTEGTPPFTVPAPVKFISGTQLANGHHNFVVTNMRQQVNWVLFEGSLTNASNFRVVATSPVVSFTDAAAPMHLRLARTSSTSEMRVSWTSALSSEQSVAWGYSATALNLKAAATSHTYAASDLCGYPANQSGFHDPGHHYEAVRRRPLLTSWLGEVDLMLAWGDTCQMLSLGSPAAAPRFYYKVGSDAGGWSAVRSFKAPAPVSPHTPVSLLVTADMGETYEDGSQYHWEEPAAVNTTVHLARLAASAGADVLLHPGDLAYATGYEGEWDRWMEQIEPLSSAMPYMVGFGNHERDFPGSGNSIGAGDSGGECGVPTESRFHMPTCAQPNTAPCLGRAGGSPGLELGTGHTRRRMRGPVGSADDGWYSFEVGSVHVLMVNTEMSSKNGSRQHAFVDADLAAVDRSITPWVLVFGHRQMYCGNMMGPGNDMGDLEPLFNDHKVDIAFWGHIHYAQRSCPMYKAQCVNKTDAAGCAATPTHACAATHGRALFSQV
jgi:hypothetical protein